MARFRPLKKPPGIALAESHSNSDDMSDAANDNGNMEQVAEGGDNSEAKLIRTRDITGATLAATRDVLVTVPAGVASGQRLLVTSPFGGQLTVTVPAGARAHLPSSRVPGHALQPTPCARQALSRGSSCGSPSPHPPRSPHSEGHLAFQVKGTFVRGR